MRNHPQHFLMRGASAAALLLLVLAAPREALAANGAVAVDDTDVDPVGACKLDSWASFASKNRDRIGMASPGCVFNFGRPVDITFGLQGARSDGTWATSTSVKVRTLLVPGEVGKFSLLFSAATSYDFQTGGLSTALVNIPLTFQALENLKFNLNGGWLYERAAELHWATWGAGFDWSVSERISLIGEVYGQLGHNLVDLPHANDARAQFAFRLKPNENMDFDVIYGRNLTGENAHWVTVGINVRFNAFGEPEKDKPELRRLVIRK
jgi:hypothetical protein